MKQAKAGKAGADAMSDAVLKKAAAAMSQQALDTLATLMSGDAQPAVKLAAAREVLDRAHGKPKPPAKPKPSKPPLSPPSRGMTVIVKRFSDITPEEEAAAEATERGEL